jgi:hypothetical protein
MSAMLERGATIEIRLASLHQLFNSFDPSPFHERDLDQDAEDYLVESSDEFPAAEAFDPRHPPAGPCGGLWRSFSTIGDRFTAAAGCWPSGARFRSSSLHLRRRSGSEARYSPLIGIVAPFAPGVLGSVTVRSPFLNAAETLLASTPTGSRTPRVNTP